METTPSVFIVILLTFLADVKSSTSPFLLHFFAQVAGFHLLLHFGGKFKNEKWETASRGGQMDFGLGETLFSTGLKKAEPFLPLPFFLNVTKSSKGNLEGAKVLEFKWK